MEKKKDMWLESDLFSSGCKKKKRKKRKRKRRKRYAHQCTAMFMALKMSEKVKVYLTMGWMNEWMNEWIKE